MARIAEEPPPVKLFFALMSGDEALFQECEKELEKEFGAVDMRGERYDFDPMTDYYEPEFGKGLKKQILAVGELVAPDRLAEIKLRTNRMEEELARERDPDAQGPNRVVNIDPGYLNHSKVVLATTKDHAHRIYMGRGIFEEVTLNYRRVPARYEPHPWTYRDYRDPARVVFFGRLRAAYEEQLKQLS